MSTPDPASRFALDPRLAADTAIIGSTAGGLLLRMNDTRYPWLILVPEHPDARTLHGLPAATAAGVLSTSLALGRAMASAWPNHHINVAALGNVVAQLHLHHVLRTPGDAAWPAPVWGHGDPAPFEAEALAADVARWRSLLGDMVTAP